MLKQKLIAFAGAMGILACGACFGPTDYHPPPPPIVNAHIRTLRVIVTDSSPETHIDPAALEALVVRQINVLAGSDGVTACTHDNPVAQVDAVLQIRLTAGRAAMQTPVSEAKSADWVFHLGIAESLTRADGTNLWQQSVPDVTMETKLATDNQNDAWKDNVMLGHLAYRLAKQAIHMNPSHSFH